MLQRRSIPRDPHSLALALARLHGVRRVCPRGASLAIGGPVPALLARHLPVPQFENGMGGLFVPQIRRVLFRYCDKSHSSRGTTEFLRDRLPAIAKAHPYVEFVVLEEPFQHPTVKSLYINGTERTVELRNMLANDVGDQFKLLAARSCAIDVPLIRHPVTSTTPAVRGMWSPFKPAAARGDNKLPAFRPKYIVKPDPVMPRPLRPRRS